MAKNKKVIFTARNCEGSFATNTEVSRQTFEMLGWSFSDFGTVPKIHLSHFIENCERVLRVYPLRNPLRPEAGRDGGLPVWAVENILPIACAAYDAGEPFKWESIAKGS